MGDRGCRFAVNEARILGNVEKENTASPAGKMTSWAHTIGQVRARRQVDYAFIGRDTSNGSFQPMVEGPGNTCYRPLGVKTACSGIGRFPPDTGFCRPHLALSSRAKSGVTKAAKFLLSSNAHL
jgi:hypothetical protein